MKSKISKIITSLPGHIKTLSFPIVILIFALLIVFGADNASFFKDILMPIFVGIFSLVFISSIFYSIVKDKQKFKKGLIQLYFSMIFFIITLLFAYGAIKLFTQGIEFTILLVLFYLTLFITTWCFVEGLYKILQILFEEYFS